MPNTCCVGGCRSNYASEIKRTGETVKVFKFPSNEDERLQWFKSLPNFVEDTPGKRICVKHWPTGYKTIIRKGREVPDENPSVFSVPQSFCPQSVSDPRNLEKRGVDSETRIGVSNKRKERADEIKNFKALVDYCKTIENIIFTMKDEKICLLEMSNKIPPSLISTVIIDNQFKVECYKSDYSIPVRDLLGFAAKLRTYSGLKNIIERVKQFDLGTSDIAHSFGITLENIIKDDEDSDNSEFSHRISLLSEQLKMTNTSSQGIRYSQYPVSFRTAITLFLRSRNCYKELRKSLNMPHPKTIKACFGKLETPGSIEECRNTVEKVFSSLTGNNLYCKILVDEIHISPSIRYRGNHIIGNSIDQPEKAARTCLGLLVDTMNGGPSFMGRMLPVYSLNAELLFDQIIALIKIIHNSGGYVYLVMCDNLRANQKMFKIFHDTYGTCEIFSINHPVTNESLPKLYLLFDPTHLFKNIRNNWVTEKLKTLDFVEPFSRTVFKANWSDLIKLYELESKNPIKMTKLSYASLYPTNFEKQKVNLVVNIFNEKTIAALKGLGNQSNGTLVMIENVTKMWHIINVKSPTIGIRLNDNDRYPISDVNDSRLSYLNEIACCFKAMNSKYTHRVRSLTDDTRNGLYLTLTGIIDLVKMFLTTKSFKYVLIGEFQSDRIEGEYGIYRQYSGGNYYISYEQILSSMHLRRIELFDSLNAPYSKEHSKNRCCLELLNEDEIDLLDKCVHSDNNFTDCEISTLYYIAGYVSFKHDLGLPSPTDEIVHASEFTSNVSRGLLKHPTEEFFQLASSLYLYFKKLPNKLCANKLLKAFLLIYEAHHLEYENHMEILRTFVNTFLKGQCNMLTEAIKADKNNRNKKKEKELRSSK